MKFAALRIVFECHGKVHPHNCRQQRPPDLRRCDGNLSIRCGESAAHVRDDADTDDHQITGYSDLREEIFLHMMGDEVTSAINSLPIDFRTVILLCDIEGFTYEEIAAIIDVPIGTVRSRLFRARNLLKEKLTKYALAHGYTDVRGQKGKSAPTPSEEKPHQEEE